MTAAANEAREARRHKQFHSAKDFEASSSQIGEVTPFGEDTKSRAQRIIAASAQGGTIAEQVADATLLMQMLGVHPDDDFDPSLLAANPIPPSGLV